MGRHAAVSYRGLAVALVLCCLPCIPVREAAATRTTMRDDADTSDAVAMSGSGVATVRVDVVLAAVLDVDSTDDGHQGPGVRVVPAASVVSPDFQPHPCAVDAALGSRYYCGSHGSPGGGASMQCGRLVVDGVATSDEAQQLRSMAAAVRGMGCGLARYRCRWR